MSNAKTLVACPFCNTADKCVVIGNGEAQNPTSKATAFWVTCDAGGCGADGPFRDSVEAAIDAWNDRKVSLGISQAIKLGVPFAHPDMIGAFLVVNEKLLHRDCIKDFDNKEWMEEYAISGSCWISSLTLECLSRDDWYAV